MTEHSMIRARQSHSTLLLSDRRALIAAAAVFHILFTVAVFAAGRLGVVPQHINREGIGRFATDSGDFLKETTALTSVLTQQGVVAWFNDRAQVHVKFYSLCFAALSPLLGSNILSVEPVNLVCYLAILVLTYLIGRRFADHRSALVSAAVVALWPSLLLHTTQVLRDPLFIAAFLTLMLMLVKLVADDYEWRKGLLAGLSGAFAALLLLMSR
ncbi:MAG TPA: glycosyltransferase family 39 protein, partial [Pyrinomonadaceae bacterium]|nr:glycosyltransferase family 39 protein [Pyrinomonadaceae bacterium]